MTKTAKPVIHVLCIPVMPIASQTESMTKPLELKRQAIFGPCMSSDQVHLPLPRCHNISPCNNSYSNLVMDTRLAGRSEDLVKTHKDRPQAGFMSHVIHHIL